MGAATMGATIIGSTCMADACAQSILSRGRIPIVCGGTGLYLDALIEGNTFSGEDDSGHLRAYFRGIA